MTPRPWSLRTKLLAVLTALATLGAVVLPGTALAQTAGGRTFDDLQRTVASGVASSDLQVRLRWRTAARVVDPASTQNGFGVVGMNRVRPTAAPRRVRLDVNSLVVVSEDSRGGELGWRIVGDPRIVRSEGEDRARVMAGQTLYYQDVDLLVVIPDFSNSVRLRLYKPRPTGDAFELDPLGVVNLGDRGSL